MNNDEDKIAAVGDNLGPDFRPEATVAGEPIGGHPLTQQEGYQNPALAMTYQEDGRHVLDPAERPAIYRALNIMIMDNYGPMGLPVNTDLGIAPWWEEYVYDIDQFIAGLSDEKAAPEDAEGIEKLGDAAETLHVAHMLDSELFSFVMGEGELALAISRRSRAGVLAHSFLNDMFEGFTTFSEQHPPVFHEADGSDPDMPAPGFVLARGEQDVG